MRKNQFIEIREEIRNHRVASLAIDIDGVNYIRTFRPRERVIILGAGHVARPTCEVAALLGYEVIVVDDRPFFANETYFPKADQIICDSFLSAIEHLHICHMDYVIVMTRGHHYDAECLRSILSGTQPYYFGMMGSKRRTTLLLNELEKEGFDRSLLNQIHTPIGLSIGAMTPEEIAVSIAAELVACRRKKKEIREEKQGFTHLQEEFFRQDVLDAMIDSDLPAAWILVYETSGSTPRKSGAFMMLDQNGKAYGTIGGGVVEAQALTVASTIIGKNQEKTVHIDLTNEQAEREGMVCGGQMKLWITDIR